MGQPVFTLDEGFHPDLLVLMRRPGAVIRELGAGRFLAVQLTLGAEILSAMVHGPLAIWLANALLDPGIVIAPACLAVAALSYMAGILMALAAPGRKDARRLMLALSLPVYWPLQSLAMLRALYGLVKCPHFWAKTPHGARR